MKPIAFGNVRNGCRIRHTCAKRLKSINLCKTTIVVDGMTFYSILHSLILLVSPWVCQFCWGPFQYSFPVLRFSLHTANFCTLRYLTRLAFRPLNRFCKIWRTMKVKSLSTRLAYFLAIFLKVDCIYKYIWMPQTEGNWRQLLKNCAIVSAREINSEFLSWQSIDWLI